jgi:hypothetical protein
LRADPDIPFRNPGGWMHVGRGIDDSREVLPIEAAPRQFVVKSGEVCTRFRAHRNSQTRSYTSGQFARRQDGTYRPILPERSQKAGILEKYKEILALIRNKSESLKVAVTLHRDTGDSPYFTQTHSKLSPSAT